MILVYEHAQSATICTITRRRLHTLLLRENVHRQTPKLARNHCQFAVLPVTSYSLNRRPYSNAADAYVYTSFDTRMPAHNSISLVVVLSLDYHSIGIAYFASFYRTPEHSSIRITSSCICSYRQLTYNTSTSFVLTSYAYDSIHP